MMKKYFCYLDNKIFKLAIFGLVHIVIVNSAHFVKSSLGIKIILQINSSLNLVILLMQGNIVISNVKRNLGDILFSALSL